MTPVISQVPVIDVSEFLAGGDPGPAAAAVGRACTDVGFFQITGHGVPQHLLDGVVDSMHELMALPKASRDALASPTHHPWRGLRDQSAGGEVGVTRMQGSWLENADDAAAHGIEPEFLNFFHPNVWPTEELPQLYPAWRECFAATRALSAKILELFAIALELPIDFFDHTLNPDTTTFSANFYPAQEQLSSSENPRIIFPEHSDSGLLTVLYQTGDYTGLQLLDTGGWWNDVPAVAGSLVVNIGDLMARWTNGRWRSTRHRVIASYEPGKSRVSVPTFFNPRVDSVIAPLPSCVGPEGPLYEPVRPYEWEGQFLANSPVEYSSVPSLS